MSRVVVFLVVVVVILEKERGRGCGRRKKEKGKAGERNEFKLSCARFLSLSFCCKGVLQHLGKGVVQHQVLENALAAELWALTKVGPGSRIP